MRESQFLNSNADKWKKMEGDAVNQHLSADDLAQSFIEVTDDLAYAKTFYPKSNTVNYLNGLAALYHQKIYKNKKEHRGRIIWLWQYELPYLFKIYRKTMYLACIIFVLSLLVGIFSAIYDESFIRLIMGDSYVNMTLENIKNGDPFGVYKKDDSLPMFLSIAFNNIRVTFFAFVSGIFFSVGPVIILFQNILMLGAFEVFLFQQGLGLQSILVIFIHGTLEIWGIVIAVTSGLVLGNSILFPGTYSRIESLLRGAKDGLKIVLGMVPLFVVAGFLEGYVTRHTQMPVYLSGSILLLSLLFIIWYFFLYPNKVYKKYKAGFKELNNTHSNFIQWSQKKSNSEK